MNYASFPNDEDVVRDLGQPFIQRFIEAVAGARGDLAAFREWQPSWQPNFSNRFIAGLLHERIWDRLIRSINDLDGFHVTDKEPIREVRSGTTYTIRVKRHREDDSIATYPTAGSNIFWSNSRLTLGGLESLSLALGYYWDDATREVGDPVLSFRDGTDHPIWAITLRKDSSTVSGFTWSPVQPDAPELDLSGLIRQREEEEGL